MVVLPDKSKISMTVIIYLRLDVVHKGLYALIKVPKGITLSTCEA